MVWDEKEEWVVAADSSTSAYVDATLAAATQATCKHTSSLADSLNMGIPITNRALRCASWLVSGIVITWPMSKSL